MIDDGVQLQYKDPYLTGPFLQMGKSLIYRYQIDDGSFGQPGSFLRDVKILHATGIFFPKESAPDPLLELESAINHQVYIFRHPSNLSPGFA